MKAPAVFGLAVGGVLATALVFANGLPAIGRSLGVLGLDGLGVVVACHLILIGVMGAAWWLLGLGLGAFRLRAFVWGRLVRDSASEVLPLSQIGGFVLGARAATVAGVPGACAAALTVVDVSAELVAQLAYTLIGLALLQALRPDNGFAAPVLLGVGVMAVLAAIFVALQARGAGLAERLGARLARQFLGRDLAATGAVRDAIHRLHRRRGTLLAVSLLHLATWLLAGLETWLTLRLMGIALSPAAALAIDALLYGIRSIAFMIPGAIGVQEGGLVLLGALFGVAPGAAIALSLVKRARDLAIGIPVLLAWQALEGRLAWRRDRRQEMREGTSEP